MNDVLKLLKKKTRNNENKLLYKKKTKSTLENDFIIWKQWIIRNST